MSTGGIRWLTVGWLSVVAPRAAHAGPHPNMYLNQQEIDAIKAKVAAGAAPWTAAYNSMIAEAGRALSQPALSVIDDGGPCGDPDVHKFSTDGPQGGTWGTRRDYTSAIDMSRAVMILGLAYAFTGEARYANKAIALIDHWAVDPATYMAPINRNFSPATCGWAHQWSIEIMITIPGMLYGADLIWSYSGWDPQTKQAFADWARAIGTDAMGQDGGYYNNGENWRLVLESSAGALVDDEVLLEHAFRRHQFDWDGITNAGRTGQILNQSGCTGCGALTFEVTRSTGLDYSLYAVNAMTQTAEIARHRGWDLYGYQTAAGWGLELVLDYHAPFAASPSSWPWQQTSTYSGGNAALYELAYLWSQKPAYMSVVNKWGRPMDDSRVMGPVTLTHAYGAYPWQVYPAATSSDDGAPSADSGPVVEPDSGPGDSGPADSGAPDGGSTEVGDASRESPAAGDADDASGARGIVGVTSGCSCGATGGSAGPLWLALWLAARPRRRRGSST